MVEVYNHTVPVWERGRIRVNVLTVSHASSFVGRFNLLFRSLTYYFFTYLHIIMNIKSFIKILLPSFRSQLVISNEITIPEFTDIHGWKPAFTSQATVQNFLASFICFIHTLQDLKVMCFFFLWSAHFIGFPSLIFVILGVHSRPPLQHFDLDFIFLPPYLAFFIIPVIHLLPFFICHHLISNCCNHFLNILPLSFTCFLILITSLLIIFSVENTYFYYHTVISGKIHCPNPILI